MTILALVPALVATVWIARRSCRDAYVHVYLFTLFLLPGWCRFIAPGTPDPTFHEAALLPIAAAFFLRSKVRWRFSAADVLVVLFAFQMGYSEYRNAGYKEAQNLLFDLIAAGILPYLLAKGLLRTMEDRTQFARKIATLLALLSLLLAFESRFANNPYRLVFDRFFPGQGDGWVTTFRYGLARAAGPFGHAILAGIVFLIGFHLQRWLETSGLWESQFRGFKIPGLNKSRAITGALFAGLAMTMVRGPQVGAVIAAAVSTIGSGPNPRQRARWVAIAIIAIGIPLGIAAYSYAAVGRAAAKTTSQESAAYRKELIDKYVEIALDHSWFGWGRNGWPKVAGMPSIDNYYLLLSLMHGVPATVLILALLASMIGRLLRNGIRVGMLRPKGSSLSFRLAGIFAGFTFAILTVYIGDNVVPIFFTLIGFAEGYLLAGGDFTLRRGAAEQAPVLRKPRFAVVLA